MLSFLIRRIFSGCASLFIIALIVFFLLRAVPGGPFDDDKPVPPDIMKNLEAYYGLDKSTWEQFLTYIWNALHGDLGVSYSLRGYSVNDIIKDKLVVSAELGMYALIVAFSLGIPLGVLAAYYHNSWIDYLASSFAILFRSFPLLAKAPLMIIFFSLTLKLLPVARWTTWDTKILPTFALGLGVAATIARLTRASMLQVIKDDFIRTARAKGLPELRVVFNYALRNALLPVLTLSGPLFAMILTGTLVIETMFAIPGIGKYFILSISNRDYPVVMGVYLMFGALIIIMNTIVDILYAWVDPRIRLR